MSIEPVASTLSIGADRCLLKDIDYGLRVSWCRGDPFRRRHQGRHPDSSDRNRPKRTHSKRRGTAFAYVHSRKGPLQVFLEDPDVPIDTNGIERQIRPIPWAGRTGSFVGPN
jgi:hypothetical protein